MGEEANGRWVWLKRSELRILLQGLKRMRPEDGVRDETWDELNPTDMLVRDSLEQTLTEEVEKIR